MRPKDTKSLTTISTVFQWPVNGRERCDEAGKIVCILLAECFNGLLTPGSDATVTRNVRSVTSARFNGLLTAGSDAT